MFLYLLGVQILKLGFEVFCISKCQVSPSKNENKCQNQIIMTQFVAGNLTGKFKPIFWLSPGRASKSSISLWINLCEVGMPQVGEGPCDMVGSHFLLQ